MLKLFCVFKAHEAKCMADKALEAHSSNTFTEIETEDMDEVIIIIYHFDLVKIVITFYGTLFLGQVSVVFIFIRP